MLRIGCFRELAITPSSSQPRPVLSELPAKQTKSTCGFAGLSQLRVSTTAVASDCSLFSFEGRSWQSKTLLNRTQGY